MKLDYNTNKWGEFFLFEQQQQSISNLTHGTTVNVAGLRRGSGWQLITLSITMIMVVHAGGIKHWHSGGKTHSSGKLVNLLWHYLATIYFNT